MKIAIKTKTVKIIVFALILAFYASLLTYKIKLPAYDDLARQLKNGEMIVQGDFSPIYKNVYSYTEPENSFNNHHWLSTVIFYLIQQAGGFNGLVIFKVIVLVSAFAVMFAAALKKANFWLVAALSYPAIIITSDRSSLRPEIFSFLFIAVFLYLLIDFEKNPANKKIFWLIPLQLLWVNLHLFFIIGPLLVAGFLLEKIILNFKNIKNSPLVKKTALLLLLLVVVCFINPAGARGALFLDALNNFSRNLPIPISELRGVSEWVKGFSPWTSKWFLTAVFMAAISGLGFIFSFWKKSFVVTQDKSFGSAQDKSFVVPRSGAPQGTPIFYLLVSVGSALAGFYVLRMMAIFGFVSLVVASAGLNGAFISIKNRFQNKRPELARFFGGFLILVLVLAYPYFTFRMFPEASAAYIKPGVGLEPMANSSAEFFKEQGLKGPIFNDPDIGSYLIYHLYPSEKVFTDNRFSDTYSYAFLKDEYLASLADDDVWQELLSKYDFNVLFLYQYDQVEHFRDFLYRRVNDPDWVMVYADMYALILVKNIPKNAGVIQKFEINKENVGERMNHLLVADDANAQIVAGDVFNLFYRSDLAYPAFLKILARWPDRGKIWGLLAEMELMEYGVTGATWAAVLLERAIELGYETPDTYYKLGSAYARLGQFEEAEKALNKALKINSEYQGAKDLLEEIRNSRQK